MKGSTIYCTATYGAGADGDDSNAVVGGLSASNPEFCLRLGLESAGHRKSSMTTSVTKVYKIHKTSYNESQHD